jgi:hypothetical protein
MKPVQGPKLKIYAPKRKQPTHEYYKCGIEGCPFVVTIEIPQPEQKPKRLYPKVRQRTPNELWNPEKW